MRRDDKNYIDRITCLVFNYRLMLSREKLFITFSIPFLIAVCRVESRKLITLPCSFAKQVSS